MINCSPNSRNVIPGKVFFTIDLRHPEDATLSKMAATAKAACEEAVTGPTGWRWISRKSGIRRR